MLQLKKNKCFGKDQKKDFFLTLNVENLKK